MCAHARTDPRTEERPGERELGELGGPELGHAHARARTHARTHERNETMSRLGIRTHLTHPPNLQYIIIIITENPPKKIPQKGKQTNKKRTPGGGKIRV